MAHTTGTDVIVRIRADSVQVGQMVDLEGDKYGGTLDSVEFAYGLVAEIERETPDCIAITFEGDTVSGTVGFPAGHLLAVVHVANRAEPA